MAISVAKTPGQSPRLKILDGWNDKTGEWSDPKGKGFTVPKLLRALQTAASQENAAIYAGTNPKTVRGWIDLGKGYAEDTEATDRMDLPLGQRVYVDFAVAVGVAQAQHEVDLAQIVSDGAITDPDLALKVLGRRYNHWREQKAVDVTSKGESIVQDRIADLLGKDPTLAASAESFALALEGAAGEEGLDDEGLT